MSRRWRLFTIIGVLSLIADQATKFWARAALEYDDHGRAITVPVIQNYWEWRLSQNPGSAFGMLGGLGNARVILTVVGIGALGLIVWMARQTRNDQTRVLYALGMVAGGAVGNIADRIAFGTVTDFIVWRYQDKFEWPTFNVADIALVVGIGLLLLDMGKKVPDDGAQADSADAAPSAARKSRSSKKSKSKSKRKRKR